MLNENRFLGTFRGHNTWTINTNLKLLSLALKKNEICSDTCRRVKNGINIQTSLRR